MSYNQSSGNFYNEISKYYSNSLGIEVAELQRTIILPILPEIKISYNVLKAYDELQYQYDIKEQVYGDMVGNFYISMLFPMVENGKSTEMQFEAPTSNTINPDANLKAEAYNERNFTEIVIPKHIVCNFRKRILKGTKFLVGFVGGSTNMEQAYIIDVASRAEKEDTLISLAGKEYSEVLEACRESIEKLENEYKKMLAEDKAEYGH